MRARRKNVAILSFWMKSGAVVRVPVKEYDLTVRNGRVTKASWTTMEPTRTYLKVIDLEEVAAVTEESR